MSSSISRKLSGKPEVQPTQWLMNLDRLAVALYDGIVVLTPRILPEADFNNGTVPALP
jgi:hypothetical protein